MFIEPTRKEVKHGHTCLGPGGMDCPCCRDLAKPKMKRYLNRKTRHALKVELIRETLNDYNY